MAPILGSCLGLRHVLLGPKDWQFVSSQVTGCKGLPLIAGHDRIELDLPAKSGGIF